MSFDLGSAFSAAIAGYQVGGFYGAIAGFFIGGFAGGDAKRSARNKARDAYNAAQKDRAQMVQSATAPHNIVYGQALTSGPLAYAETTGDKGQYLHLVVLLAAHEVDSIGEIYFNDQPLGTLDGSGYVTGGAFWRGATTTITESGTGSTISLSHTPSRIIAVVTPGDGVRDGYAGETLTWTLAGNVVTPSPAMVGTTKYVTYEYESGSPLARVKKHLGSPTQTADATLIAESAGKWTSNHRLRGIAYLYLRIEYDQDIFGAIGIPNIRAVVNGRKVYDPRTGLTAWSDNAALCTADYLRTYMQADSAEVIDAELTAAADICDQLVTLDGGGTTERRYTANGVLSTESPCKENLDALTEAMAGAAPYVQGRFLVRAGAHTSAVITITEDMLADGGVEIAQTDTPRTEQINRVVPKYVEPAKTYATVEATAVTNALYVTADGGLDLPLDITYDLCTGAKRAQRLGKIALERARQGMRATISCNLRAYDVAPTDVVAVTLDRYGWATKLFEVESRSLDLSTHTIKLAVRETAAGVWDWNYGDATAVDLTPNTSLTSPFERPAALTGVSVSTGTAHLAIAADGTIVTRGYVTWTQSTSVWVVRGGAVEIESIYADRDAALQWQRHADADGAATSAYIGPLTDGRPTLVRLRARTAAGKRGPWTTLAIVPVGQTAPPANLSGAAATLVQGGVRISWARPTELDYADTEWRVGASFAAGARLFRGSATDFTWLAPAQGSYTLWGVHYDTTGNASTSPTSLSITVDANALVQWGSVGGRPKTFRVAATGFASTTHPIAAGIYDGDSGALLYGGYRSYSFARVRRSDGAITYWDYADVYADNGTTGAAEYLAGLLDGTGSDSIAVVYTYDEPSNWRLQDGLAAAMYRCGASQAVFGSPSFRARGAYVLIGIGGCGEGNGFESYQGAIDSDPNAWCDVSFLLTASGQFIVTGSGATPRTLADYSYSGALDATRNVVTYASTAPSSPANGDVWVDTSVTPNVTRVRVAGAWQVGANLTTNTNQLTDGAGLGSTATWSGVSGSGKPADNATQNLFYNQPSDPGSVPDGALWKDTGVTPAVIRMRVSGAWVAASNLTTGQLAMLDSVGTPDIQDGAVTTVLTTTVSSASVLQASGTPVALASITFTADYTCTVLITANAVVDQYAPSEQWSTYGCVLADSVSFSGSAEYQMTRNPSTSAPDDSATVTRVLNVTQVAGTTKTYYFAGLGPALTGSRAATARSIVMKLEAILK